MILLCPRPMDLDCAEPTLLNATELEQEVKAVPVVTSVSTKPTEKDYFKRKANHGVTYKLRLPSGGAPVTRRSACTEPSAEDPRPTLAHALHAAIKNACDELGVPAPDGVARPVTQAELAWLEEWCESHDAPHTITTDMADAALSTHRAAIAAASSAASGAATSGARAPTIAILQTTQLLRTQLRAAERRAARATQAVERWQSELESHREPKRARQLGSLSCSACLNHCARHLLTRSGRGLREPLHLSTEMCA